MISAVAKDDKLLHVNALAITLCAIAVQGTGFLISLMVGTNFFYRLMTQMLPEDTQRPGIVSLDWSVLVAGLTDVALVHFNWAQRLYRCEFRYVIDSLHEHLETSAGT